MKPVRVELAHRANYGVRRGKIEWIVMALYGERRRFRYVERAVFSEMH